MTRRRDLPAMIDGRSPAVIDEALAAPIVTAWVAAVRHRFGADFSREWLETTLRRRLRDGDSLTFVIKVVEAGQADDEIADAALREVAADLMERPTGRVGEWQILGYLQRAALRPPHRRRRGGVWYDDWQRKIGICVMIKLACAVFGVKATRSQESRRAGRHPSGVSLVTEALARNGDFIAEKTVQRHLWFGLAGELVRGAKDDRALGEFVRQWARAEPFLADFLSDGKPR